MAGIDLQTGEAIPLVREFIQLLEEIPDGCAEVFPFEIIDLLREEYLNGLADQ